MKKRLFTWIIITLMMMGLYCINAFASSGIETEESQLWLGAAVRDVSPTKENGMLPIPGNNGNDAAPITDVIDPIHTRVLAFQSGDTKALLVCTETGKGPTGWQFAAQLSEHTGIPVDAIFYMATHSHAAPSLKTEISLEPVEGEEADNMTKWGRYVLSQMFDAADEALANMQPVTAEIGYSESYINMNRNAFFTSRVDGTTTNDGGYNPTGVSDKTVSVVKFNDMSGKPVAFLVNYPVHAVTMIGNTYFDGDQGLSADIPGVVSTLLEEKYEGCVAVWSSGAAGDQNPIVSNQVIYPDPVTGEKVIEYTGDIKIMEYLAYWHYEDILKAIDTAEPVDASEVAFASGTTTIPNEEGAEEEEFTLHLKVLRLGNIVFAGSPGELYTSLGMYMKEHSIYKNTIVFNHVWTEKDCYNGYILDDEGRANGSMGGGKLSYKPGYINDALADLMNQLIEATQK